MGAARNSANTAGGAGLVRADHEGDFSGPQPQLSDIKDVVATRPGYKYPPAGQPVPAIVVAVTPGTTPVKAARTWRQSSTCRSR